MKKAQGVECMVCGKIFPRGVLDLARHSVTLKHIFSDKMTAACMIPCGKCGFHFPSESFLLMHKEKSSCSSPNSSYLSNSRESVYKRSINIDDSFSVLKLPDEFAQLGNLTEIIAPMRHSVRSVVLQQKQTPVVTNQKISNSTSSNEKSISKYKRIKMNEQSSGSNTPVFNSSSSDGIIPSTPLLNVDTTDQASSNLNALTTNCSTSSTESTTSSSTSVDSQSTNNLKRSSTTSLDELLELQKSLKKEKLSIIPEERKAYFAVISLLIDKSKWAKRRSEAQPETSTTCPIIKNEIQSNEHNTVEVSKAVSESDIVSDAINDIGYDKGSTTSLNLDNNNSSLSSSSSSLPSLNNSTTVIVNNPDDLIRKHADYASSIDYERFISPESLPILEKLKTLLHYEC